MSVKAPLILWLAFLSATIVLVAASPLAAGTTHARSAVGEMSAQSMVLVPRDSSDSRIAERLHDVESRLDAQDRQIALLAQFGGVDASRFGIIAALFATLITAIVVFFTLQTSKTAVKEAKLEVRSEAESEVKKFTEIYEKQFQITKIDGEKILKQIELALGAAKTHLVDIEEQHAKAEVSNTRIAGIIAKFEGQAISKAGRDGLTSEQSAFLTQAAEAAASRPEQSFDDWYIRGVAAAQSGDHNGAIGFFEKAEDLASSVAARAKVMNVIGAAKWYLGEREVAASIWDRLITSYSTLAHGDPSISLAVAKASRSKGFAQAEAKQFDAAIATFDELLERFADATEPAMREQIAMALHNKGFAQAEAKQFDPAIATYDQLLERFADATEPAIREYIAKALYNKGTARIETRQFDPAIATYDQLLERFADATEPAIREHIAKALYNKGVIQSETKQLASAIATYDQLLGRFADATEPAIRELNAKALVNKGVAQHETKQIDSAIATYDQLLEHFADATEPAIRGQMEKARQFRAWCIGQQELQS